MEAQSEQMQASIETMFFFSVRELSIYGTGYRLLWWRLTPLTRSRRDWMIGMMWNYKLLLTSTTTASYKLDLNWSRLEYCAAVWDPYLIKDSTPSKASSNVLPDLLFRITVVSLVYLHY